MESASEYDLSLPILGTLTRKPHVYWRQIINTAKIKDPSLFVQEIGLDEIGSENYQNGVIASPPGRRKVRRPKTAGPQRIVGRPVLASRDDVVEWTDGEAFFVAGNARLGSRKAS